MVLDSEEMRKEAVESARRVRDLANRIIWSEGHSDTASITAIHTADMLLNRFFTNYKKHHESIKNGYDIGLKCSLPAVLKLCDEIKEVLREAEKWFEAVTISETIQ